jgi:hypothetical protein
MAAICAVCRNIPFAKLPAEDEPAYPHQPSLEALAASAAQCQLCGFIQEAIAQLRTEIDNERNKRQAPRFTMFSSADKDTGLQSQLFFGPALPADLSGASQLGTGGALGGNPNASKSGRPMSKLFGRKEKEPRYEVVRPWLYGSWWTLNKVNGGSQPAYKLIGVGVRVAKTPNITDAEGNDGKLVKLRGTQFRIRTLDGRSII